MNGDARVFQHRSGREVGADSDATDCEVLADGLSPTAFRRIAEAVSTTWVGRHQAVVRRTFAVLGLAAGLAAAALALRPATVKPLPIVPVIGVSIEVPPPRPGAFDASPIVATYRIEDVGPGAQVSVTGVTGPFVRASEAHSISRVAAGRDQAFGVSSVPDCSDASSLGTSNAPYLVAVTRAGSDGRVSSGRVHVRNSPVDWGAAIRQYCWERWAAGGIGVGGLTAEPDRRSHQLTLRVTLHSRLPGDVQIRVIDIADVATLAAADSGTLRAGADRVFRVRWPTADCSLPVVPLGNTRAANAGVDIGSPALTWSVGPIDTDPAALFTTKLSPSQASAIRRSVQLRCDPPATSIHVTSSYALPQDPVIGDRAGVSIAVRLSLVSTAPRIVLGQDQASLTSDARVPIGHADVRLTHHRAMATIVWNASCALASPVPPLLPLHIGVPGHLIGYSVTLDDAELAATYANACGISDQVRLRDAGWDLTP